MWATVRWNWGVDLHELTEKDLRREGDTIICRLPEPKLLEYCITDPADIHYMTKATAIPKVRDWFAGQWFQHTLEARMRPTCERFAKDHGLKPSRAEIARQLNGLAALFQAKAGVKLRFE